ncbi:MoxR-like ATPase [Methanosarcina thermophila]|uniref:MoxR-related protein n=2 Tax=Methanosarcina thermophila TaxID=2210 RepID=A0A0E3NCW7_METTE|nr:AAA family ATPase [Methanosarcina thermophila]AKB15571.1 MoxR-related protein [Methanosarcina thermophila CHTI-55]ALK05049.1 MAG: ATPase AAA [Methanosarcina sp. 795]SFT80161.1 MoxR-like ATPase [Methanosarcina thermophila]
MRVLDLKNTILNIKQEFSEYFKERDAEINGSLLALLSGEHILLLGPPGTAKTLLANKICETIEGGKFFHYLLTRFSTPEEVFGPLSLKALERDEFSRRIEGYLPTAHIALLDEIFKANSSILNSLLTVLNERKYHNGKELVDVPLFSVFGASNELPEEDESLEALYDRFLFRYKVDYIQHEENLEDLIFKNTDDFVLRTKLSIEDIKEVQKRARDLPVDPEVRAIIKALRRELKNSNIFVSDRRWKKIVNILRVASVVNGHSSVNRMTAVLLQHMLWDVPEQREAIRKIILDRVVSGGTDTGKLKLDILDLKNSIYNCLQQELPDLVTCNKCYEEDRKTTGGLKSSRFSGVKIQRNLTFDNALDLLKHHTEFPTHTYSFGLDYSNLNGSLNFESLAEQFRRKYGFEFKISLDYGDKKLYEKEYENLEEKVNYFRRQIQEEEKALEATLRENIWVSEQDSQEILMKYRSKNTDIYEIVSALNEIRILLEKPRIFDVAVEKAGEVA